MEYLRLETHYINRPQIRRLGPPAFSVRAYNFEHDVPHYNVWGVPRRSMLCKILFCFLFLVRRRNATQYLLTSACQRSDVLNVPTDTEQVSAV